MVGLLELVGAVGLVGLAVVPGKIRAYRDHRDQHAALLALAGATGSTPAGWKISLQASGIADGLLLSIAGPRTVSASGDVVCATDHYVIVFEQDPSSARPVRFVSAGGLARRADLGVPAGTTCSFSTGDSANLTGVVVPLSPTSP